MKILSAFILILLLSFDAQAQEIFVTGKVQDQETRLPLIGIYVVNKRTSTGSFADGSGNFSITIQKEDTLLIASRGYQTKKICLKDSSQTEVRDLLIFLQKLNLNLEEVSILPQRELKEIEKDIYSLKSYDKSDYTLQGYRAVQSPITALYQEFSRKEINKRKVAELRLEDQKKDILRELFFRYSVSGVLVIPPAQYEDFMDFCNVPVEFLSSTSQYQLILYFKEQYRRFASKK